MADWHLNEEIASELVKDRLATGVRQKAVRHLLSGCAKCSHLLRATLRGRPQELPAYERAVGLAIWRAAAQVDDVVGEALWGEVERLPRKRRADYLRKSEDHRTAGVFNAGARAVRQKLQEDRRKALDLAEVLVVLAEYLDLNNPTRQELRYDRRAEAALVLSQARLKTGNFAGAQAALEEAEAFLELGTGSLHEKAMGLVQRANLLGERGEFEQAVAVLDRTIPIFRRLGDQHSEGRVLLHQGEILRLIDPERGLVAAEHGLTIIDKSDKRAELSAQFTLAYCQNELGEAAEAESILDTYRYLIQQFAEPAVQLAVEWLYAKIRLSEARLPAAGRATGEGVAPRPSPAALVAEAEQRLRWVQGEYLALNAPQESVLVTIDLVDLLVAEGRTGEGLYLVDEVVPVLRDLGLNRDYIALVLRVNEALAQESIKADTLRTIGLQLRRSWHLNETATGANP